MSSPSGPRSNSNSTKQLLDELDSLMQRMLELPVADASDATTPAPVLNPPHLASLANPPVLPEPPRSLAPPPPPKPTASPAKETPKPEPAAPRLHSAHRAPAFVPIQKEEKVPRAPERPTPKDIQFSEEDAPPPVVFVPPPPKERPLPQPPVERPKRPTYAPLKPLPAVKSAPEPPQDAEWMIQMLVWTNRVFYWTIGWFGSKGEWLQTNAGRRTLGWSGILLLLVAFAWGLVKLLG